jgi:hypothetical protein
MRALSQDELAQAFSNGRIGRRTFVRGLIATGVAAGAAVAYAQLLEPAAYGVKVDSTSGSGTTGGRGGSNNSVLYGSSGGSGTTGGHGSETVFPDTSASGGNGTAGGTGEGGAPGGS